MSHPFDPRVLEALESDLPATHRPFRRIAQDKALSEKTVLDAILGGLRRGVIRRYGALVAHGKIGFEAEAVAVWQVPEDRLEEVAALMSAEACVTQCIQRQGPAGLPCNLYTTLHAATRDDLMALVEALGRRADVEQCEVAFSLREFKQEGPIYSGWEHDRSV